MPSYKESSSFSGEEDQNRNDQKCCSKKSCASLLGVFSFLVFLGVLSFATVPPAIYYLGNDVYCNGTSYFQKINETAVCKIPPKNFWTKVEASDTYTSTFPGLNFYLFDKEPPLSDVVIRFNKTVERDFDGDFYFESFLLLKGSNVSFSLNAGECNTEWKWLMVDGHLGNPTYPYPPIIVENGTTFNMKFTAVDPYRYVLRLKFLDCDSSKRHYVNGTYEVNYTTYVLDNPVKTCVNKSKCIFWRQGGKYLISTSQDFAHTEFVVGKDIKASDTDMSLSIAFVCLLFVIAVFLGIFSCVLGHKQKSNYNSI